MVLQNKTTDEAVRGRLHSKIPLSVEICKILQPDALSQPVIRLEDRSRHNTDAIYETLYIGIAKALEESGLKQVLELGAGLCMSPRGALAVSVLGINRYVEFDEPEAIWQRQALVDELCRRQHVPSIDGLIFKGGRAGESNDFFHACSYLKEDRLAIICENLSDIDPHWRISLMKLIVQILRERGGVFIASDLRCDDVQCLTSIRHFFRDFDLKISETSLVDFMDDCACVRRLELNKQDVRTILVNRPLFVMTV